MESSYMDSLFGLATTIVMVEKEPPPAEPEPFKIPMKIAERVINNCYYGDGTVHPGDHLLFLHELCDFFKCAGISMDRVRKKLFSISLKGKAAEWFKLLKNGRSISRSFSRMFSLIISMQGFLSMKKIYWILLVLDNLHV